MSTPLPSKLVFLSDLRNCEKGAKVRFLGCVDEYAVSNATLHLKHSLSPSGSTATASVNIEHVLDSTKRANVEVGSWINVIGYVERRKEKGVWVQAIAVWSAGNLDLDAYQKAVEAKTETI